MASEEKAPVDDELNKSASKALAAKENLDITKHLITGKNPRGIPTILFIEDIDAFLPSIPGENVTELIIGAFTELHAKYKVMDQHTAKEKTNLKTKIPEIERTLELVHHLIAQKETGEEMTAHYSLSETVYAKAQVENAGTVCLWLGASIMLEYSYEEALEMLQSNLANAKAKLDEKNEDLDHLRNQIITVEVNMARVFNYDVKRRREEKGQGESKAS